MTIALWGFGIVALLMPLLNRLALRVGLLDRPHARKIHSCPTPLLGGLGVYLGILVPLLLYPPTDPRVMGVMLISGLAMLLGIADDRWDLPALARLILQMLLALGLSLAGVRFDVLPGNVLDHMLTVLWFAAILNAVNCLDCADGAAGGTSAVAFGALAAFAAAHGQHSACQIALAGAGATAGFLLYNRPPARVFLGNGGSTLLGMVTAALAILADPRAAAPGQVPIAPLILSVPLIDLVWVHYRRHRAGIRSLRRLLASKGKDHLPHRLMAWGLSSRACMGLVALCSALAAVATWGLASRLWLLCALGMGALLALLFHIEWRGQVLLRQEDHVALYRPRKVRTNQRLK